MESEGSSKDDMGKCLEDLRCEATLLNQEVAEAMPGSTLKLLADCSKLWEASVQLTKEEKSSNLDVIVRACVAAMVGLLNIYTDVYMGHSWKRSSEIVAKMQGHGTNHVRHIHEWVLDFLRWRDLPLHQLNRKRGMIINDKDIAEEMRTQLKEKAGAGFLKTQDVVDVVASLNMQAIFTQKGIAKETISVKTALHWLEKLGWTYRKLKNGMYLDGHEGLMWWNTGKLLWSVGWDMSDDSINGIMMGQNFHAQMGSRSLGPSDTFILSSSRMMNPPSFKTMSATQDGATLSASPNRRPRVTARP
jgi:hypothetical protein